MRGSFGICSRSIGAHLVLAALAAVVPFSGSARAATLPNVQTVFIIVLENNSWSDIKGSARAPYLNGTLLPAASYCEGYQNVPGLHPSLPNYLWLVAGTNFGILDDNDPALDHQNTTKHLATLLNNAGISWKAYQEDISGTSVPLTAVIEYSPRHNPFVYFDDVTGTNNPAWPYGIAHLRPYSELAGDLANNTVARYNFITPNVCDDMHDSCGPSYDPIRQGDNWLAQAVPNILASRAYSNNGALFITWDECGDSDTRVGMILLSPLARGHGYTNSIYYTHSSTLRTFEEIFQVAPFLGDAASAADLSDLFQPAGGRPAPFAIATITRPRGNVMELTAEGVTAGVPLVLQWSSNLPAWTAISTNLSPPATCSFTMTNAAGKSGRGFYRATQRLP